MGLRYKVVETSAVTDDALEAIINEWVGKGWLFEGIQFATRDASKRPSMAFVLFTANHSETQPPSEPEPPPGPETDSDPDPTDD